MLLIWVACAGGMGGEKIPRTGGLITRGGGKRGFSQKFLGVFRKFGIITSVSRRSSVSGRPARVTTDCVVCALDDVEFIFAR